MWFRPAKWLRGLGLALALVLLPPLGAAAQEGAAAAPSRVIVLTHGDPEPVARDHGLSAEHVYASAVRGFAAPVAAARLDALRADPRVRLIEPDFVVSLPRPVGPTARPGGAAAAQPAQVVPTGVNRVDAELNAIAKIDGVDDRVNADIAIIDTGIQPDHPDLNVVGGKNCANGRSWSDGNGHGTHVAGIAAAKDNGIGVVGVAPGARLWSVRVLDNNGSGFMSWVICGVDWVAANASTIEVANMSLGCNCSSAALDDAITTAVSRGVVFTVAAGNNGADASAFSPANHPDVLAVSAVADYNGLPGGGAAPTCANYGPDDSLATFSNFGAVVDIAAPGVCIRSTYRGSSYATLSGTSMASPHVAGGVALYLAHTPKPTDAAGVANVRAAVVGAGFAQTSPSGFSGDSDGFAEPLLNAANL